MVKDNTLHLHFEF